MIISSCHRELFCSMLWSLEGGSNDTPVARATQGKERRTDVSVDPKFDIAMTHTTSLSLAKDHDVLADRGRPLPPREPGLASDASLASAASAVRDKSRNSLLSAKEAKMCVTPSMHISPRLGRGQC